MGLNTIGAVGVALPPPQALYPATIGNQPGGAVGTNRLSLPPGGDFYVPSGTWLISPGQYSQLQVLDPVSNTWGPYCTAASNEPVAVSTDGTNYRIVNPTGFPIGAAVVNGGTGYATAPVVAASLGGSSWVSIVGGALSAININTGGSGLNYAVPPIVNIASPPTPGVPATAVCAISAGLITGFTITNPGAGYTSNPAVVIVPQASDGNYFPTGTSTTATRGALATAQLSYVGVVTGVLLTNEGANPLTVAPALTFTGGGGSGVLATAVMAFTVTNIAVTTGGSGFTSGAVAITTVGGSLAAFTSGASSASNSPSLAAGLLIPRQAQIAATGGSGTGVQSGTIIDGGLFSTVPVAVAVPGAALGGANPVFVVTVGGANDTVFVTPL